MRTDRINYEDEVARLTIEVAQLRAEIQRAYSDK